MDKQRTLCFKAVSLIFQHTLVLLIRPSQVNASVLYFSLQINDYNLAYCQGKTRDGEYLRQ